VNKIQSVMILARMHLKKQWKLDYKKQ